MTGSSLIVDMYERLLGAYGPQHWWPAETPFEVIVGAILTQSTSWANVARAIANLKARDLMHYSGLRSLSETELAELIRPSGYFRAKARKLKAFLFVLEREYAGDLEHMFALPTPALRERLLAIYGVGPETADSIALYAAGRPTFVVDAYTRRICVRLGLAEEVIGYEALRALFEAALPSDPALFNEYHALLVRHGKYVCRRRPLCPGCVVQDMCLAGREIASRHSVEADSLTRQV